MKNIKILFSLLPLFLLLGSDCGGSICEGQEEGNCVDSPQLCLWEEAIAGSTATCLTSVGLSLGCPSGEDGPEACAKASWRVLGCHFTAAVPSRPAKCVDRENS